MRSRVNDRRRLACAIRSRALRKEPRVGALLLITVVALCGGTVEAAASQDIGVGVFEQIDKIDTWPSRGLVVTAEHSGRVLLWNGRTKALIGALGDVKSGPPVLLRFIQANGTVVLLDNSGHLRMWEVDSRRLVRRTEVVRDYVEDADISPDGQLLLVRTALRREYHLHRYDLYHVTDAAAQVASLDANEHSHSRARFVQAGQAILVVSSPHQAPYQDEARLLDARTARERGRYSLKFQSQVVALSPDERILAVGTYGGEVDLWDLASGKHLRALVGKGSLPDYPGVPASEVTGLAFSPDASRLAAARGKRAMIWNLHDGKEMATWSGLGVMAGVGFLDEGKTLAAAGWKAMRIADSP